MILLDAVPSKNYFISIFKEKGYHLKWLTAPSIEMVRCMVGQGLGFSDTGHPALLRYDLRW